MIVIPTTKNQVILIDEIDKDLAEFTWSAKSDKKSKTFYAVRGDHDENNREITVSMHRVILARMLNRSLLCSEHVDHANLNGLDNRRTNLRLATPSQNHGNTSLRVDNKSGHKGVFWLESRQKWQVNIRVQGKQRFLGRFKDYEEAVETYRDAADHYFREFARYE